MAFNLIVRLMSTQFKRCPVFWYQHSFPAERQEMVIRKADLLLPDAAIEKIERRLIAKRAAICG
jgi:hypothetical protein